MSLWFEKSCIALTPERLIEVRLSRGLRPQLTVQSDLGITPDDSSPWAVALDTLRTHRKQQGTQKRIQYAILLSGKFVRFQVIPWQGALIKHAERMAYAKHCFREAYGAASHAWDISLSEAGYGKAVLAAAVDREFLEGIRTCFKDAPLVSIKPWLTAAYSRFCSTWHRAATPHYFCGVEGQELHVIRTTKGEPSGVYRQSIRSSWQQALQATRLQATQPGETRSTVSVFGVSVASVSRNADELLRVLTLDRRWENPSARNLFTEMAAVGL
ncbi:MAG: hypothetical protein ACK59Y_12620 [Betaproteobacteria bacterium]